MASTVPSSTRLDHVGLAVADLDAAAAWYVEAFGYEREVDFRVEAIELDIVMLMHPEHGDRLELLHRSGSVPGPRFASPAEAAASHGFGHVAFDLVDVDSAYARLIALGAAPVMPPGPAPEPGVRMAYVADPEGNLVEIIDRSAKDTAVQGVFGPEFNSR